MKFPNLRWTYCIHTYIKNPRARSARGARAASAGSASFLRVSRTIVLAGIDKTNETSKKNMKKTPGGRSKLIRKTCKNMGFQIEYIVFYHGRQGDGRAYTFFQSEVPPGGWVGVYKSFAGALLQWGMPSFRGL